LPVLMGSGGEASRPINSSNN